MSSIYTNNDTAMMNSRQLRDTRTRREELQTAIENTMRGILNDDDRMKEILSDYWDRLVPTLSSLAREHDADHALSLHKQIRDIVGNIAVRETTPPEPSSDPQED